MLAIYLKRRSADFYEYNDEDDDVDAESRRSYIWMGTGQGLGQVIPCILSLSPCAPINHTTVFLTNRNWENAKQFGSKTKTFGSNTKNIKNHPHNSLDETQK